MLNVNNLTKRFGGRTAVEGVSFSIKPGEIFSLIGPNGSGKTTIVKTVAGLLRPDAGGVSVGGFDTVVNPVEAKGLLGYIPDEPAIWPGMTGEEFLNLTGALYSLDEKTRAEGIPGLLATFDLKDTERGDFDDYSRGNKQKFAILAALLHKPKLLLIDEPIVGLDPTSAGVAEKLFADFAREGGAVLLVTHTLSVAQKISHRIGVLKNGRLLATGTLDELRAQAKLSGDADLEAVYRALA
jgi:ABC-2 type transport system ATP-binding protein